MANTKNPANEAETPQTPKGGSTEERWQVTNTCFADNVLYHAGDIVDGGDFSDNPNFKKLG